MYIRNGRDVADDHEEETSDGDVLGRLWQRPAQLPDPRLDKVDDAESHENGEAGCAGMCHES